MKHEKEILEEQLLSELSKTIDDGECFISLDEYILYKEDALKELLSIVLQKLETIFNMEVYNYRETTDNYKYTSGVELIEAKICTSDFEGVLHVVPIYAFSDTMSVKFHFVTNTGYDGCLIKESIPLKTTKLRKDIVE